MRKHFLTFIMFALVGCKSDKIPEGILSVEKMAAILIDVHLAEGKVQELNFHNDTARVALDFFEMQIFSKHQVDRKVYEKSFNYHLSDISSMNQIYGIVVDSLNVRRQISRID